MYYKESKYNIKVNIHNGFLIYNTFSGSFGYINSQIKNKVLIILKDPNCNKYKNIKSELIKEGFIIKKDFDELKIMEKQYDETKNNSKEISIVLLSSENCNFSCPYCFIGKKRGFNMDENVYTNVLKMIKKNKKIEKIKVQFFGGEPLLNHKKNILFIDKLNKILAKNNIKKDLLMVTNGYLLNKEIFLSYFQRGCKYFQVTFDGYKESHNILRFIKNDTNTFEKIYNNLIEIKKIQGDFEIWLRINFTDSIKKNEMFNFINLIKKDLDHRFKIYFRPIMDFGNMTKNLSLCNINSAKNNMLEYMISFHKNFNSKILPYSDVVSDFLPSRIPIWCDAVKKNFFIIGADGLVFKCDVEAGNKEFAIGKIHNDGIIDIKKKNYYEYYSPYNKKECLECKFLPLCQGGCMHSKKNERYCFFNMDYVKKIMVNFFRNFN